MNYAEELAAVTHSIERLKRRYVRRRSQMTQLMRRETDNVHVGGGVYNRSEDYEQHTPTKSASGVSDPRLIIKHLLACCLLAPGTVIPVDTLGLHNKIRQGPSGAEYKSSLESLHLSSLDPIVHELATADAPYIEVERTELDNQSCFMILSLNKAKLAALAQLYAPLEDRRKTHTPSVPPGRNENWNRGPAPSRQADLESLLEHKSVKDRQQREQGEELIDLIQKRTARESAAVEKFQTDGSAVREYCPHLTKEECRRRNRSMFACPRLHFRRLIYPWTDISMGNCSYLDTCRNIYTCKYVHYELDPDPDAYTPEHVKALSKSKNKVPSYLQALSEPQWIKCDVRSFDMTILGKFGVIMADPPWEIHQDLPYGTMADEEMRKLNIGCLQDEGVIFLWVTGRAMELGRECLQIWGYHRVDELIWVKTNQLQRLIRTGRTGHWLNHSKEHCLVGIKGNPELNRYVDCDVVVAEVRETSRKPDEMYPLLERLSPGTRKLELFARMHNLRNGWVSLGNQLSGSCIKDVEMRTRYEETYGPLKEE
eukprot:g5252.t1